MSLPSAKWGEHLFNIYFYLPSSTDIRPLPLLGLATASLTNLLHSSASFITNHLFCFSWASLHPQPHLGEFGASPLKSPWKRIDPGLDAPCCLGRERQAKSRLEDGAEDFYWHRKIPPAAEGWPSQFGAICSLILPLFQKHIQKTDHASSWRMWSGPEKSPSRQPVCWDLCNQHKLEQPLGWSELRPELFQILIRTKCFLGLLFFHFICHEHKLEAKIAEFTPHCG